MNFRIDHIRGLASFLLLVLIFPLTIIQAQNTNTAAFYNSVLNLPIDSLYHRANAYQQSDNTIDSALVCYNVLSNRIASCKDYAERRLGIKALAEMAYIQYFHYFDYPQAFAHLTQAEELSEKWGIQVSEIPLFFGLMHGSISQQSNDVRSAQKGMDYLRQAFNQAHSLDEGHNANLAYSNLLTLAFTSGTIDSIADVHSQFVEFAKSSNDNQYYYTFNRKLYEALEALQHQDFTGALNVFDSVVAITPDEEKYSRYLVGLLQYKAIVNEKKGDYASAVDCLEQGIKIAKRYNLKDAQVELYRQLAEDASRLQRNEDKYLYQNEYLVLKDSVLNYQQVASIDEVKFLSEMKKAESEMQQVQAQRKRLQIYMILGAVVLVIVLGWFYALYVKNRQLRRREKSLYQKNVEIIKAEENERRLRSRYQNELLELRQQLDQAEQAVQKAQSVQNVPTVAEASSLPKDQSVKADRSVAVDQSNLSNPTGQSNPTEVNSNKDLEREVRDDKECTDCKEDKVTKYKGSNLKDEEKELLMDRIRDVMENNDEIYSPNFSGERLATILETNYKYVSQTINEVFGNNFNTLLNNYRIREACRRITDQEKYGNYTLEALSMSVGFKSRSTFVLQFKRITGLTPSQYQTEARKEA